MYCSLILILSLLQSAAGAEVVYDYDSPDYGVTTWATRYPDFCNGTKQSPVDIVNAIPNRTLGNIKFDNYMQNNVPVTVTNNGHTYATTNISNYNPVPFISGGGLPGIYQLAQFHFHWGNDSTKGSEHTVNGKKYAAELHLVHVNTKYSGLDEAVGKSDGLAVLGIFIEEGDANPYYDFINLTRHDVTYPGNTSTTVIKSLMGLLPREKSFYRYYNGSLTTPKCNEVVTWTVFNEPITLSHSQLEQLRGMKYITFNKTVAPLVNNFRPVEPLNGRMVHFVHSGTSTVTTTVIQTSTTTVSSTATMTVCPTMPSTTSGGFSHVHRNVFVYFASLIIVTLMFLQN